MIVTVNTDLTSRIVSQDGLRECLLPAYNPETTVPFSSEDEVRSFIATLAGKPQYFTRIPTAEELAERAAAEAAIVYARSRTITNLAYMNLFTDAELVSIYTAAKTYVSVEVWLEKFRQAEEINKDDPKTIQGLADMEASGLLAAGRAAEILA